MIREYILNNPAPTLNHVLVGSIIAVIIIILGAKILPTQIVKHLSHVRTPSLSTKEKTLGVTHFLPEAIIIFTLIQIWFHIAAAYTLLLINVGTTLLALTILLFNKPKETFPHIQPATWFLLALTIIIPVIVIYDYAPISWNTTLILIVAYATYVFITKTTLNEPSHPVYYNPADKTTKKKTSTHLIFITLLTVASIILILIGTELFITYTQLAVIYHNVDKLFYSTLLAAPLVFTKARMFYRSTQSNKLYPELYAHEISYNTAATNMTNTLFVYTLGFTYALIMLNF